MTQLRLRTLTLSAFLFLLTGLLSVSVIARSSDQNNTSDPAAKAYLQPDKSPNDDRQYRYQVLENGLEVLLISDPKADKGAAALDVNIGSGDEPADRAGIAHFLEHMLFLGTEKYPEAGEYQQFISNHGGSHNASTAFQHTNYFFDVNAEFLEPALDRFAQQFVAPLFNPEFVDRERNAVHSEYTSKLQDDGRRFFSAFKAALNPEHRYNRFAVGNLETLGNADSALHEDVVEFYRDHYKANVMTLVVYGPQSLETLEGWVKNKFDALPSARSSDSAEPYRHTEPLLDPAALPALLKVDSLKDSRRMTLSFPMPSMMDEYKAKPTSFIANLVGHEGPGSLLDVLKGEGLVNGLSAGTGLDTRHSSLFQISMSLTPQGLEKWNEIVALTFDYIDKLRDDSVWRRYFEEQQKLSQISFRFAERGEPIRLVSHLAGALHDVAPEDVISASYLMSEYAPELYRTVLKRLQPDNVLVSILAPGLVPADAPRTEWYDTPYQLGPLKPKALQQAGSLAELDDKLALPEPNRFIPENLELVRGPGHEKPIKLATEPFTVWYGHDASFGTPRANVYLSLRSPAARAGVRENLLTQLWVESIRDQVNAAAYPAQLAGLDYTVYNHLRGITLRVGGYSDKIHELLGTLLSATVDTRLLEDRFEIHKRQIVESLENARKDKPYSQALGLLSEKLIEDAWPLPQRLEVARTLTFEDLQAFVPRFLEALDPVMLAHGNLTPAAGLNLSAMVKARLGDETEYMDVGRTEVRRLADGSSALSLPVQHPDTGYVRYLQGDDRSYESRASYRLLSQMVSAPFYQALRTEQQLGYIVFANAYELLEVPGLAFIIQSPVADGATLDRQVIEFIEHYGATLESMDKEALQRQKASVISRLLEEDKTLKAISERWWREIDRENTDFDSREQMVAAVKALDLETMRRLYNSQIETLSRSLLITTEETGDATERETGTLETAEAPATE